ncbi:MAG TPA: (Fe-S)-binding protein, partial [Thermoleophilia bacterium]|nr:(Fe-S)-binding protein [Thermoleophilia bacterium]
SSGHPAKRSGKPSRTIAAHEPEMDTTDSLPAKARSTARAFLRAFAGRESVVSISGSCAAMVRDGFPDLFAVQPEEADAKALAARTYEFSEFLVDVLGVEELPVARRVKATLHHSCHTRRLLGVVEQPERLLA